MWCRGGDDDREADEPMTAEELKAQWLGKYVRTERPPTPSEVELHRQYGQPDDMPEGGEGVVADVFEENGVPWLAVDWGYAWAILPGTVIMEVERGASGP